MTARKQPRAYRRNAHFGRRPVGNTTPTQRRQIWFWTPEQIMAWLAHQKVNGQ